MASKKRRKRYSSMSRRRKETHILHFLPILFIIAIVPLIMRGTVIELTELEQAVWIGQETRFDIFSFHKSIWFVIMTVMSLLILVWLHLEGYLKIRKAWAYYVPLSIYGAYVFLSWIVSDDVGLAARGFIELFQGFFVLISYGVIVFVAMNMVRKEEDLKPIAYAFGFVGIITFFIGFSQWFGFDVFRMELVQRFMLPNRLSSLVGNLNFTFGPRTIYATMYNTNFVGSFAALMVPLSLGAFLYVTEFKHKVYTGSFFAMMVFVWFGSNSRAGILGVIAALILIVIFMRRDILVQPKVWGTALSIIIILPVIMNIISDGRTARSIVRLNPINEAERFEQVGKVRFEDVLIDEFRVDFITESDNLSILYSQTSGFIFLDQNENVLQSSVSNGLITLDDERYEMYSFLLDGANGVLRMFVNGRELDLFITDMGFLLRGVGGVSNIIDRPRRVEFLDGREEFGSQRGYIWSRSIPMLLDTLFIGHGPDMYVTQFPQRDFAGRLNGFVITGINDKPHNMFLQIAINTGLISLIGLMSVYAIYFIDSLKVFLNRKSESFLEIFGLFAFASISGYLVAGVFNDQIISVAPLFYVLTGIGIAINFILKESESEKI